MYVCVPVVSQVRRAVGIPVIASSGAGVPPHFADVFEVCGVEAALAASILHKDLVSVGQIKDHLAKVGVDVRPDGMSDAGRAALAKGWSRNATMGAMVALAVGVAVGLALMRS